MPLGRFERKHLLNDLEGFTGADIEAMFVEKRHSSPCEPTRRPSPKVTSWRRWRVRPTVTPDMVEYYSKMEERLTSGLSNIKRTRDTQRGTWKRCDRMRASFGRRSSVDLLWIEMGPRWACSSTCCSNPAMGRFLLVETIEDIERSSLPWPLEEGSIRFRSQMWLESVRGCICGDAFHAQFLTTF